MKRQYLRLVARGGKTIDPQPVKPNPRISVDSELVDVLINVLDLLLVSRSTQDLAPSARGCPPTDTRKPSEPTKNQRRKS
jgi:hypothetical protein